jgi:hypothetical protein
MYLVNTLEDSGDKSCLQGSVGAPESTGSAVIAVAQLLHGDKFLDFTHYWLFERTSTDDSLRVSERIYQLHRPAAMVAIGSGRETGMEEGGGGRGGEGVTSATSSAALQQNNKYLLVHTSVIFFT